MPEQKQKKWWRDFVLYSESGKIDISILAVNYLLSFFASLSLSSVTIILLWEIFDFDIVAKIPYSFLLSIIIFFVVFPFLFSRFENWLTEKMLL